MIVWLVLFLALGWGKVEEDYKMQNKFIPIVQTVGSNGDDTEAIASVRIEERKEELP